MATYYEIINVASSATQSEIEMALDAQYNKVRRLVTHHDANVVNQANQALELLEQIRATLTDARKRSSYDAAIGASATIGGLADLALAAEPVAPRPLFVVPPVAVPAQAVPPIAAPAPRPLPRTTSQGPQGWICPKCKTTNVANSQFCKACGETLSITCPACASMVEKGAQFCTKCGVSIEQAQRKLEMESLLGRFRQELGVAERSTPAPEANVKEYGSLVVRDAAWALVSLAVSGLLWLTTPLTLPGISLAGLMFADSPNYLFAALTDAFPLLVTLGMLVALVIVMSIFQKVSAVITTIGAGLATILFFSLPVTVQQVFEILDAPPEVSFFAALAATALIFPILIGRILAAIKQSFDKLKPYYKWIPNPGCLLSTLLGWCFNLLPILYATYAVFLLSDQNGWLAAISLDYEPVLFRVNAGLLLIGGIVLIVYALLVWRAALGIDARFKQAVALRLQTIEKLTQQVRSLEQAVASLNLRPQ